jgi:hypothetical protein
MVLVAVRCSAAVSGKKLCVENSHVGVVRIRSGGVC